MMQLKFDLFENIEEKDPEDVRHKKCTACKEVLPETKENFHVAARNLSITGNIKEHYSNKCGPCSSKARMVQRRLTKTHGHKAFGTCDCCGIDSKEIKTDRLDLDHCHQTEAYRGHLCSSCNRGIGLLGDDIEGVQRAINYLKKVELKNEED